jgi:D-glycero-D-manno-heptose 1,7-bisphosphate phosphatase
MSDVPGIKKRAVFLDRDGVINRAMVLDGRPYPPRRVEDFLLMPDAVESCAKLKEAGFLLIVVTNQPDVGRKNLEQSAVEAMHAEMCRLLPIDRVEVCYAAGQAHGESSDFRKPAPGMVLRAAHALGVDLAASWLIGDRWRDIDCGHSANCRTIFVDCGYRERLRLPPDYRVKSLAEAVEIILEES